MQDSISLGHGPGGQPIDMDVAVARVRHDFVGGGSLLIGVGGED